jgi:thiol-disulfide isomerase/thioredoxin
MAKEFRKKLMHETRRKLVDMIQTGEYETNTKVGWEKQVEHHEVGDIWEDEHHRYEKKEGYTMKSSKNSEAFQEIRDYLEKKAKCKNPKCKRIKKGKTDKTLIQQTGYCVDCLAEIETNIKHAGIWQEYQDYKIWTRMIVYGTLKLEQFQQAYDEAKQVYEYINEDGTTEKWELPQSVDEVKADIMKMIINGREEIKELEEKRIQAFNIVKSQNYEHYL